MIFFFINWISLIIISTEKTIIIDLKPNTLIPVNNIKIEESILFKVFKKDLKPNSIYTFQLHRLGALGINYHIKIICNDIVNLKEYLNKDIKLNDVTRRFLKINKFGFPKICGNNYIDDFFIISAQPKSKVYQLINEKEIEFNIIVDFFYNNGGYSLRSFLSTGLYKALILIFIITPFLLFIYQKNIKKFLIYIIGINVKED